MQLLKPFAVTLANNIDPQGELINENIIGDAVMGWLEPREIEQEGEKKTVMSPVYSVVWRGQSLVPASSVYENHEIASLGYFTDEGFDDDSDEEDDDFVAEE